MSAIDLDDDPWDYEIEYDPDDCCPPKEEPDCGGCNDSGWYRPRGWRRLVAQLAPLIWGRGSAWNWRPQRGAWPCPGCNTSWIDWQFGRFDNWRWRRGLRRRRRTPGAYYGDEPPF